MANDIPLTVIGNLTVDPELRYTQSGTAVANITVASAPRTFNRNSNEWEEGQTTYLRGTVWDKYAEHAAATLQKGDRVIVSGNLVTRAFEKDGQQRTVMELQIEEIGPVLRFHAFTRDDRAPSTQPPREAGADDVWTTTPIPASGGYNGETPF